MCDKANEVIEVRNKEHGQKVKRYFLEKYPESKSHVDNYTFTCSTFSGHSARFYGFINGNFDNYSFNELVKYDMAPTTLPETSNYPKVMWVSNGASFSDKVKRVVFMEKCGRYLAWSAVSTLEASEKEIGVSNWTYAKDIEPESQFVELTIQDISEGKGVGVPAHLIRIKK